MGRGRERRLNRRFVELRSWYLFDSRFCNVAIRVLLLLTKHPEEEVRQAVGLCVRQRAFSVEAVLAMMRNEPLATPRRRLDLAHRPELAAAGEGIRPASLYDQLDRADEEVAV